MLTVRPFARGLDEVHIAVRRDGRRGRILALSGVLSYYTAQRLPAAYHALLEKEGPGLHRLVLDLRNINQFDATGVAALVEVVRDAETRAFPLLVADRPDRPTYIATGLRERLRFLTEAQIDELPCH